MANRLRGHVAYPGAGVLPSPLLSVESDERLKEIYPDATIDVVPR